MSPFILRVPSFVLILGLAAALAATAPRAQTGPQPPLPTTRLTAGMHIITAELATTPQSRTIGMMFREKTAPNHGMLFVFEYKAPQCFWMRNTPLPLSIAFIEDDGTIVQITDMAPKSDALHCSKSPVRFALEMEQGWFARKGLAVGARLSGLPASR
ncbi:MAG: DUF192 domain-containing protein [Burkholderiaceae bacterium]|jgi:uncharacterized membrane protein (UPF0127 family)|nr:DUF192 domain-containing protein [Burkholderiaceae bacterium]